MDILPTGAIDAATTVAVNATADGLKGADFLQVAGSGVATAKGVLRARRTIAKTSFALVTAHPLGGGLGALARARFELTPLD